jgi:hypothetical protein
MALLTPRYWWFLATSLIRPPRSSLKRMKFSTRSSRRDGSQVPRIRVSRETAPCSPSLLIRFHSAKCSQAAVRLPMRLWLPLDSRMRALCQNRCGDGALVVRQVVPVGVLQPLVRRLEFHENDRR